MRRRPIAWLAAVLLSASALPAAAADPAFDPQAADQPALDLPGEGVPCGAPVVRSFPSVWQGRFQGGYAHYVGVGGPVVLDWRDERLCFPDRGSCRRHVDDMRRDFHKPEGYFTCLPIR